MLSPIISDPSQVTPCPTKATMALLPCPLSRPAFLKASHFALGPDPRAPCSPPRTEPSRDTRAAPARGCVRRRRACLFPRGARWEAGGLVSETHRAFLPPPPPAPGSATRERTQGPTLAKLASNVPLRADERARPGVSTARADFGEPEQPARTRELIQGACLISDRDSVPPGDPAKLLSRTPPSRRSSRPVTWALSPARTAATSVSAPRPPQGSAPPLEVPATTGDIWQCLQIVLVVATQGGRAPGGEWMKARDTPSHHSMHMTAPHCQELSSPPCQ